ncbi:acyl carrier protein [Streptomyces sp. DSM 44915]|uniref:Acyl carrier protein n=1 Tax=Streptomyces chisholmiae TaxID=3075540 RepID=A0ABU2JY63_9ACTN|nr:acyl carrier protein [Streptomyces sp. DSM 44915]MDT0269138.1 acyl carrier protein [Streptomyces sp. DSM 44915]
MTSAPESATLRDWLTQQVASYVRRPAAEIRGDVPLADYGLDSVSGLAVCGDIEDHLGIPVELTLLWDHPTIDALSEALREQAGPAAG